MTKTEKAFTWAGAFFLVAYFVFFTRKGLAFLFDNDDMYSIYMGWTKPWSELAAGLIEFWKTSFRPAGLLLYRTIFEVFGFDPLPFRIVCLTLTLVNLALCFWFVQLVSDSWRVSALAALFFAFHSRLMEVWYRTAIVYDILCFTFFYLGLCLYASVARSRTSGQWLQTKRRNSDPALFLAATARERLSAWRTVAVVACFLGALDSKEMAVAFPVVLLLWEGIFHGWRWRFRPAAVIGATGLMAAIFILTKTHGGAASMADPSFTPSYTLARFEQNWNGMLTHMFLLTKELQGSACLFILGGLLVTAAALRNRILLFAFGLIFTAAMPIVFIPPRGGYVLYISYPGWCLFAAILLVMLQDAIVRKWPQIRLRLAVFVFLLIAWRWGKANLHDQRIDPQKEWLNASPRAITNLIGQVTPGRTFSSSTPILFVDDGFQTDEYTHLFVLRLFYRDPNLIADRTKTMKEPPADWSNYRYVFRYEGGRYKQVKPAAYPITPAERR